MDLHFSFAGKGAGTPLVFAGSGKHKLLPGFLYGDYSGASSDRVLFAAFPDVKKRFKESGQGAFMLSALLCFWRDIYYDRLR